LKNFGLVPLRRQRELAVFLPVRPDGAAALVWDIDGDRLRSANCCDGGPPYWNPRARACARKH
jgi:hypothetical protein